MAKFEEQREHLSRMIARDSNLQAARLIYERMSRMQSALPEPLASMEWAYPITSSSPYDALRGATRALSNKQEGVRVHPASVLKSLGSKADEDSKIARMTANDWEKNLKWQGQRLEKRDPTFRSSIVWSSCLYHEIVGQLIHLPTQFKASPIGKARERAALRIGDWALRIVDPKTTYIDYSDFMPERVACVTVKTVQQLIDLWPETTKRLQTKLNDGKVDQDTEYVEIDFTDYENRVVWCVEGNDVEQVIDDKGITLFGPEPWLRVVEGEGKGQSVPFLPWIAVCGGLNIDAAPEHQRKPMLYPVYMANQWDSTNIMGTILASLSVSEAAAPTNVITGPGAEKVEIDYTQAGGRIDLPNQLMTYQRVQRAGLDKAMADMFGIMDGAIKRSTVAEVLVTGQPMGGEQAYAAYNLQVMQALASLGDFKLLGERFLEEAYQKMLLMSHYTGYDIVGYGSKNEKYTIDSDDIDPDAIYISVELKPDVMVNELQRTASAVQMAQSLPYAPQKILEQLGEEDPEGSLKLWKRWRLELADFEGWLQKIKMTASGEIDQLAAQKAQEIIKQMMEQAQTQRGDGTPPGAAAQGLGIGGEPAQNPNAPPGTALQGGMFNPAGGGNPPAMAAPEATFEGQMGMSRGGQESQGGY